MCAKTEIDCCRCVNTQVGRFFRSAIFCLECLLVTEQRSSQVSQFPGASLWASLALPGRLLLNEWKILQSFFLLLCQNVDTSFDFVKKLLFFLSFLIWLRNWT